MTRDTVTFLLLVALVFVESLVGLSEPSVGRSPFLWILIPLCFGLISPNALCLGPTLSTQMIAVMAISRLPDIQPSQIIMLLCAAAAITQVLIGVIKKIPSLISRFILEAYAVGVGFWLLLFYSALLLGSRPQIAHFLGLLEDLVKQRPQVSLDNALVVQLPAFDFFSAGFPDSVTILMVLPFAFLIAASIIFDYTIVRDLLGFEEQYPVKSSVAGNIVGMFFGFAPISISPMRARLLVIRPLESRGVLSLAVPLLIGLWAMSKWSIHVPVPLVAVFGVIATWKLWEPGRHFAKTTQRKTNRFISTMVMFQTMAWNLGLMIPFLFALEYCLKMFRRQKDVSLEPH